jgi:hypothetical protein
VAGPLSLSLPKTRNGTACAFYATNDAYAVAVLVATRRLRKLGIAPDIDIVALHHNVSGYILDTMRALGVITIPASPPWPAARRCFRDSLLKLRIFQLIPYERVVFLDADSLPLTNLVCLFEAPFSEPVALPRAYWLPQPYGTSALMVVRPSVEIWRHLQGWIEHAVAIGADIQGDMDVINSAFEDQRHFLPAEWLCLNGEWGNKELTPACGGPDAVPAHVQVIHFSDLGKPWFHHPRTVRRLRPNARERYYEFWEEWWRLREDLVRARPWLERVRYKRLGYRDLLVNWLRDRRLILNR